MQTRIAAEVAPIDLGPEGAADALTRLVYTRATVQEALWLYPPAYGIFRVSLIDPAIGSKGWELQDIKPSVALDLLAVEVERITPADPAVAQNGARLELTTPKKPRMLSKHKHVVAPTHASVIQRRSRQHATALPTWVEPQLTMLVDRPPDGLHEIKFDGYRMPGCSRRRIG